MCAPVEYQTQYSMAARDDYKRCVCDKFGRGEADCALDESGPAPHPSPKPDNDPWKTLAELDEIKENPNYSDETNSHTLYQVDREMDFLEKKISELYKAAIDNKLIQ